MFFDSLKFPLLVLAITYFCFVVPVTTAYEKSLKLPPEDLRAVAMQGQLESHEDVVSAFQRLGESCHAEPARDTARPLHMAKKIKNHHVSHWLDLSSHPIPSPCFAADRGSILPHAFRRSR